MNRKGQSTAMETMAQAAVGVAVLAIVLSIAFLVLDEGREQADQSALTSSFNESYAVTADSFVILSGGCSRESSLSIICVYNSTIHAPAEAFTCLNEGAGSITPNWTVSGNTINISDNALGNIGLTASVNVSYTCKQSSNALNGTATLTNATADVPGWIPLIIITIIGSVLLGLVAVFRRRQ